MDNLFDTSYIRFLSDDEKEKWTLLRAMEWARFPLFATQPLVPFLLIFMPWQWIAISMVMATWAWLPFRYSFVSLPLAEAAATLASSRIFCSLAAGAYLAFRGDWTTAAIAALWPIEVLLLMLFTPNTRLGVLQTTFAEALISKHGTM